METLINTLGDPIIFLALFLPATVAVGVFAQFRLEWGLNKWLFLGFLSAICLYGTSIGSVNSPAVVGHESVWIVSRIAFASIQLVIAAGFVFSVVFTERLQEFKSPLFVCFAFGWGVVFFLVLSGQVEAGVKIVDGKRAPVHLYGFPFLVLYNIAAGLYFVWFMYRAYLASYSRVLRFQISYFSKSVALAVACVTILNGLLPMFGDSRFSIYGAFSFFFIFYGIINLLINEKSLLARDAFNLLTRRLRRESVRNLDEVRRMLIEIDLFFEGRPSSFNLPLSFETAAGRARMQIAVPELPVMPNERENAEVEFALRQIPGMRKSISELQQRNLFLGLAVERFQANLFEAQERGLVSEKLASELTRDHPGDVVREGNQYSPPWLSDKNRERTESNWSGRVTIERIINQADSGETVRVELVLKKEKVALEFQDGKVFVHDLQSDEEIFSGSMAEQPFLENGFLEVDAFCSPHPGEYWKCRVRFQFS